MLNGKALEPAISDDPEKRANNQIKTRKPDPYRPMEFVTALLNSHRVGFRFVASNMAVGASRSRSIRAAIRFNTRPKLSLEQPWVNTFRYVRI